MNKSIIAAAKEKYDKTMLMKKELTLVKTELEKMKDIKQSAECLEVIEREEKKIPSEEEILKYSFFSEEQEESECEFYVLIGAYRREKNGDRETKNYQKADYFVYQNLEKMFSGKIIYPQEQEQFEKEHIVFRFSKDEDSREKFSKLQVVYFRQYLTNENISQMEMCTELVKHL